MAYFCNAVPGKFRHIVAVDMKSQAPMHASYIAKTVIIYFFKFSNLSCQSRHLICCLSNTDRKDANRKLVVSTGTCISTVSLLACHHPSSTCRLTCSLASDFHITGNSLMFTRDLFGNVCNHIKIAKINTLKPNSGC